MLFALKLLISFPYWWYYLVPRWFAKMAGRVFLFLDRQFALVLMFRLWFTPIFGDPNIVGRSVGFIFRSIRIVMGAVFIFVAEVSLFVYFLVWLALPFLVFSRLGRFSLLFLLFWFVFYVWVSREKPAREIAATTAVGEDPHDFLNDRSRRLLQRVSDVGSLFNLLLSERRVKEVIFRLGFDDREKFLDDLGVKKKRMEAWPLGEMLRESLAVAVTLRDKFIEPQHFFMALLKKAEFRFDEAVEIAAWQKKRRIWHRAPMIWEEDFAIEGLSGSNRSWTGRVTPTLNKFGVDLTLEAQRGYLPLLVGKKKSLAEVIRVLEKGTKNNVILVGQPGCGKTSLVFGIAEEIAAGTRSRALMDKRLFSLEIGKLIAGAKTSGDLQERMIGVIHDIEGSGNIILFIDEIQNAISAGGGVDTSLVFSALEPHLTMGRFQMIGVTSWRNYRTYIEPNEAFARLFEIVEIPEANFSESLEILELGSYDLERRFNVVVSFPALKAAVELSAKYVFDRVLPDKAVDLLEETVADVAKNSKRKIVLADDAERVVSEKTNIPVTKVGQAESEALLNLESRMHERLVDQEEAVTAIANSIRRARVGLRDEKRPIVSLLFVGPTGVGKTETAKTLAATFFGKEDLMSRFDMSEYQGQETVPELISKLTESVRRRPFSLILFDEVEKSHPRILDIFLQVLDDGRLTDSKGLTVLFSNTIIVFTSNAGTSLIFEKLREGRRIEEFRADLFKQLEESFRIELLNRFDGIIIFKPLDLEQVEMITRLKLKKVSGEMEKNDVKVSFTEGLIKRLTREGFDPALGARPLRRLIQDKVESVLARRILRGEIKKDESCLVGEEVFDL